MGIRVIKIGQVKRRKLTKHRVQFYVKKQTSGRMKSTQKGEMCM